MKEGNKTFKHIVTTAAFWGALLLIMALTPAKTHEEPGNQQAAVFESDRVPAANELTAVIERDGTGPGAKAGQSVSVNYVGTFTDGKKFDASQDHGGAFTFMLGAGEVIKGWDIGVEGMKVGEKRKLIVPPEYGYGEKGAAGSIPPNATLIFEIELLSIR